MTPLLSEVCTSWCRRSSAARNDVSHQIGVDPVDDAGIHVGYLKERGCFWVPSTAIDPNHISHAPGPFRVSDDHGHSCFDVQENGIRLWRCNSARMINRQTTFASMPVLLLVVRRGQGICKKAWPGLPLKKRGQCNTDAPMARV